MHGKTSAEVPGDGSIPRRLAYPSDEVRVLLGDISEAQFRRLTSSGALKAKKIGGRVFVKHEELDRFLDSHPDVDEALVEDTGAVRDWANANGLDVKPQGALPARVVDAYRAAHPPAATSVGAP